MAQQPIEMILLHHWASYMAIPIGVVDLEDDLGGRLVAWLIGLGVEGDADRSAVEERKFRRLGRQLEPDTIAVEGNRFGHVPNAEDDVRNLHIGNANPRPDCAWLFARWLNTRTSACQARGAPSADTH